MVGVTNEDDKQKFSQFIRKAFADIKESFGRPEVTIKIVANVPRIKIIFWPNENNIYKYETDEDQEFILEEVAYPKSETIIIAAKGFDEVLNYRKLLGTTIHEFNHFAYYTSDSDCDSVLSKKWEIINDAIRKVGQTNVL